MLPLLLLFASSRQIILYSCKPVYPLDNVSVFCCLQVSTEFVYWFQWPSHKFKICWWVWMCVHAWKRERGKKWQRHRQRWGEKDKRESCKNNFLFLPFPLIFQVWNLWLLINILCLVFTTKIFPNQILPNLTYLAEDHFSSFQ